MAFWPEICSASVQNLDQSKFLTDWADSPPFDWSCDSCDKWIKVDHAFYTFPDPVSPNSTPRVYSTINKYLSSQLNWRALSPNISIQLLPTAPQFSFINHETSRFLKDLCQCPTISSYFKRLDRRYASSGSIIRFRQCHATAYGCWTSFGRQFRACL